jgi:hypothetical protein
MTGEPLNATIVVPCLWWELRAAFGMLVEVSADHHTSSR